MRGHDGNYCDAHGAIPRRTGANDELPVNTSLILFVKMAVCGAAVGRSPVADVVLSAGPQIECGVMRTIMIFAAILIGLGTVMAQIADRMTPALANTAPQKAAIAVVEQRRKPDGRWLLPQRFPGKVFFDLETAGEPSRWNTLRALRVLRWWQNR